MNTDINDGNIDNDSTNKEKNNTGFISKVKEKINKFRVIVDSIREKNPKLIDATVNGICLLLMIVSNFTDLLKINVVRGSVIFIIVVVLYSWQWIVLTSKKERELEKQKRVLQDQYKKTIRELSEECENDLQSEREFNEDCDEALHLINHVIKEIVAIMPHEKEIGLINGKITDFLVASLDMVEDILTMNYGKDICCNIKLISKEDDIKTYARGARNIKNRGGIEVIEGLDEGSIKVEQNYAYERIVRKYRRYFAEKDLANIKISGKKKEKFYCEHDEETWRGWFNSTVIIPIRAPYVDGQYNKYNVVGLLCVDCKDIMEEWDRDSVVSTLGYQIMAAYADALYMLINPYMNILNQYKNKQMDINLKR